MRILKVTVFIALVGMLFGVANAGTPSQPRKPQPRQAEITGRVGAPEMVLRGPVISVNPSAGFILMRQGAGKEAEEIPVEVDSKTTLTRGGQRVSIDGVKPGDSIRVHYSGRAGEVSKMVEVFPGKAMPAGKKPTKKVG